MQLIIRVLTSLFISSESDGKFLRSRHDNRANNTQVVSKLIKITMSIEQHLSACECGVFISLVQHMCSLARSLAAAACVGIVRGIACLQRPPRRLSGRFSSRKIKTRRPLSHRGRLGRVEKRGRWVWDRGGAWQHLL